jgi:uncharacterized protein involved in exopolysaccharide biosynthesis
MAQGTKLRDHPDFVDLDAEREVDLHRYWNALVARWWLPVLGLIGGLVIGYLLSLGGNQVYKASALLYLGQPYSGNSAIQSLATNPTTVNGIIHSAAATQKAAAAAGLRPGQVRNKVTSKTLAGAKGAVKAGQTPLIEISLTGKAPHKTAVATNVLAAEVVGKLTRFVNDKIRGYEALRTSLAQQLTSNQQQIATTRAAIASAKNLSPLEQLVLISNANNAIQQRGQLLQAQATNDQQLSQAQNVEKPQIVERAVPVKTTARSRRNSMLVAAFLGLLLGIFAALLWEPVTRRLRPA